MYLTDRATLVTTMIIIIIVMVYGHLDIAATG